MKHCLVVDESRVIRTVARKILEEMKFYAEEAVGSATALETCRAQMPDVVLLNLENEGGMELVRALRRGECGKRPVIVSTMIEHDIGHISEALNAGIDDYVLKPFGPACLAEKFTQTGLM